MNKANYATMIKKTFITLLLPVLFSCADQQARLPPSSGLLVDLLSAPELAVITDSEPEFGWVFPEQGKFQSAYRILVASSTEILLEDQTDFWDSQKTDSSKSIDVIYRGNTLAPNSTYYWKVKVWGEEDVSSPYSQIQTFNTGTFSERSDDWPGQSHFIELAEDIWVSEDRQTAVFEDRLPVQFEPTKEGLYFADFGKAAFATLSFRAKAQKDNELIEIYLGERRNLEPSINKEPGLSNIGYEKVDILLMAGSHDYQITLPEHHSNSPHAQKLAPFYPEVLPFRYVEVKGAADAYEIESLTQKALYYPFDDDASHFVTSNDNLNKVLDLSKYTLRATPFLGLYADGNRERMPYEADAYIQQLGHYSVDREFSIARYTNNFLMHHASWPTEWQIHAVFMAWEDYMSTGNTEFIRTYYENLKAKTLVGLAREDGLISSTSGKVTPEFMKSLHYDGKEIKDIVDWPKGTAEGDKQARNAGPTPEGERDGYEFVDYNTVVNAFHYRSLVLMAEMAAAVGEQEDAAFFSGRSEQVKQSFLQSFFDDEHGVFLDGEGATHSALHANIFPLAFGLVPKENLGTVIEFIKNRGMAVSVYGAQYLLDGLYEAGEAEYGLALMTAEHKRSWMNMIAVGSTMTTEAWDEYYKPNLTWNHAWGAAPMNIAVRQVMGLKPIKPGYEEFRIVPQPGGLNHIEMKAPTIRGSIEIDFSASEGAWSLDVNVPGNSIAELWLPVEFNNISVNAAEAEASIAHSDYGKQFKVVTLLPGASVVEARID